MKSKARKRFAGFLVLMVILDMLLASPSTLRKTPGEIPIGPLSNGNCRLVISELNIYPPGSQQFLEITKICKSKGSRVDVNFEAKDGDTVGSAYKIVFISPNGYLVGVCGLKGHAKADSDGEVHFTIGGEKYAGTSVNFMPISDCDFAEDYEDIVAKNRFPCGDVNPVGVALLYNRSPKTLKLVELDKRDNKLLQTRITSSLEKKLMENMQDLIIFSSSSPFTHCGYFQRYYEKYSADTEELYILRDWANTEGKSDYGQSRCESNDHHDPHQVLPYAPSFFYYAPSSPNGRNKCSEKVKFIIEDLQPKSEPRNADDKKNQDYKCWSTTTDVAIEKLGMICNPATYAGLLRAAIDNAKKASDSPTTPESSDMPTCAVHDAGCEVEPMEPEADLPQTVVPAELFESSLSSAAPHIWQSCEKFQPQSLLQDLKKQKSPFLNAADIEDKQVCFWFEFLAPVKQFRCKLCHSLLQQGIVMDRPGSKIVNYIMTRGQGYNNDDGSRPWAKSANSALIQKHLKNPIHAIALDFFSIFDQGKRGTALAKEFERDDGPFRAYLRRTEVQFVNVFQCVRLDIPFSKYEVTIETLKYFDIDPGFLYLNPDGYKLILTSISETLHSDLVQTLKNENPVLSVMIDTSTDIGSRASLAVVFHVFDSVTNEVRVVLYRIMHCHKGETGQQLFDLFLQSITRDGLQDFVKNQCVGFSSDGGSNVKAFRSLLDQYTKRKLATVHCMAHRLQLAIKKAWKKIPFLKELDQLINTLYSLFNSRSAKKKIYLREAAEERGENDFEAKRIIGTRWIASKARAINSVFTHWSSFVSALKRVSVDKSFMVKQREKAKAALDKLTDPVFLSTLAFMGDVCDVLSSLSLHLQKKGSTIIGKREKREQMEEQLQRLQDQNGPKLEALLNMARIVNSEEKVKSLEEFETNSVKIGTEILNSPSTKTLPNLLSEKRKEYIEPVLQQVFAYFPEDITDGFDILDPNRWPQTTLDTFGNEALTTICQSLKWKFPNTDLVNEWRQLKQSVSAHPEFNKLKLLTPEEFWGFFLKDPTVQWSASMKTIVNNVLTIQSSTAEVERVYSYYTHSKTRQRFSMDVSTVESIVRVKYNGPKKLSDFNPTHFVKNFISKHSRADDETRPTERAKRPREEEAPPLQQSKRTRANDQSEPALEAEISFDFAEDLRVYDYDGDDGHYDDDTDDAAYDDTDEDDDD